jgi:predicted lipid-binding transport protein (Tim44 family)
MSEFGLLDWILTIAALVVSWQLHAAVLHPPPTATPAQPPAGEAVGGAAALPPGRPGLLAEKLQAVCSACGYPSPKPFLDGAGLAYERIVAAFAEGDLQPVLPLLGPAVRQTFAEAVADRKARRETLSTMLIGVVAEPVDAGLDAGTAWIEVRFAAEMVSATTDHEGRVLAGDPRRVVEVAEAWTFTRDVRSSDPNWTLVATAEDACA